MSTMLKSAAMSLLSKTLQTFLYKYLEDVDVEGVALPSLYTSDGSASGWGVRLSNVKLRSGVTLMAKLPGEGLKRKRKRRRRKLKTPSSHRPQNSSTPNDERKSTTGAEASPDPGGFIEKPLHVQHPRQSVSFHGNMEEKVDLTDDNSINIESLKGTSASAPEPVLPNTPPAPLHYYSSDDDDDDQDRNGRPSTPTQDSKSILSCFARKPHSTQGMTKDNLSTSERNYTTGNVIQKSDMGNVGVSWHGSTTRPTSDFSVDENGGSYSLKDAPPDASKVSQDSFALQQQGDSEDDCQPPDPPETIQMPMQKKFVEPQNLPEQTRHREQQQRVVVDRSISAVTDAEAVEEEYEYEEYWEEYRQPMKLQLGNGGRIGIIDARLVGKEIHVMIEDAELSIEIVPAESGDSTDTDSSDIPADETSTEAKNSSSNSVGDDVTEETTPKEKATESAGPKKDAQAPAQEPKTVGERVLAEIALAKALSLIPHLFLRDVRVKVTIQEDDDEPESENSTVPPKSNSEKAKNQNINKNDTVFEIGVDFLSVSSGDDILSHFQTSEDEEDRANDATPMRQSMNTVHSYNSADESVVEENEYIIRHIRTGKGPAGGIWLRILSPTVDEPISPKIVQRDQLNAQWARNRWLIEADYFFFRCSGVDLHARIFVGTRKDGGTYSSWFYTEEDDNNYEESLDSMFVGIDYVVPGPQLPLPPMTSTKMSRGDTVDRDSFTSLGDGFQEEVLDYEEHLKKLSRPEFGLYHQDRNGIQSCNVPSCFHRVSRDVNPGKCPNNDHLPHETCESCWESPTPQAAESALDPYTPMPGLTLQLTIRDPIELNVDRQSLDSVGLLASLFQKKVANAENKNDAVPKQPPPPVANPRATTSESPTKPTKSRPGYFSRIFYSRTEEAEKEDTSEAFPEYMQPEKIQIMGIHVAEIFIRVHVMRQSPQIDSGLSFCYWDMEVQCLTVDRQVLASAEKVFQDNYVEIGNLVLSEFRGTEKKNILSLGLPIPLRGRADSAASLANSVASIHDNLDESRIPWPTTANILLGLPPPLETIMYRSRERHGAQLRHIEIGGNQSDSVRSSINIRLGVTILDMPLATKDDINSTQKEAINCLLTKYHDVDSLTESSEHSTTREPSEAQTSDVNSSSKVSPPPGKSSLMYYKLQLDSGSVSLPPLVNLKLPLTRLSGERSSDSGIFLQTLLNRLDVTYGKPYTSADSQPKQLSLVQLAKLPESVRMRIILLLDDLRPLEMALGTKKESNSFRRCRAVNKGIIKHSKKGYGHFKPGQTGGSVPQKATKRQELLNTLMGLDDAELEEMVASHQQRSRASRFR